MKDNKEQVFDKSKDRALNAGVIKSPPNIDKSNILPPPPPKPTKKQ